MFRKMLANIALLPILSSCGAVDHVIDQAGDETKKIIIHMTEEVGKLKTETLAGVRTTVEEMMPEVVASILNADAVAFLIVSVVALGGLVLIVALLLLLGAARAAYKRWRHPKDCPSR